MNKEEQYLRDMIEHHQMAVDMSREVMDDLEHDEVKEFAQNIIDTQTAEIEQMQKWLDEWYPDEDSSDDSEKESGGKKKDKMKMSTAAFLASLPHNKALDNNPLFN